MKKTEMNSEMIKNLYFNYKFNHKIEIGSAVIKDDMQWHSHNYKESNLSSIKSRNLWVEQRLMSINAMLIDFHYNRPVEPEYDINTGHWFKGIVDENPEESKSILLEAQGLAEELFNVLFRGRLASRMDYMKLTLSMIFDIYEQMERFGDLPGLWGSKGLEGYYLFSIRVEE